MICYAQTLEASAFPVISAVDLLRLCGQWLRSKFMMTLAILLLALFLTHLPETIAWAWVFWALINTLQYGAWGEARDRNTAANITPFGFTGRWGGYTDARLGKVLNWHRWYGPQAGRWGSRDPIEFEGGNNIYSYVSNRSLNFRDPTGLIKGDPTPRPLTDILPPELSSDYDPDEAQRQTDGAISDFIRNYRNMRDANTKGADKYFHCMANCEATKRGPYGASKAAQISDSREWVDQHIKGDPKSACDADQAANRHGRSVPPGVDCRTHCGTYRPNGLPARY